MVMIMMYSYITNLYSAMKLARSRGIGGGVIRLKRHWTCGFECSVRMSDIMSRLFFVDSECDVLLDQLFDVSLFMSSVSWCVFVFVRCRSLWCDRTRIHRNLFVAMLIHVSVQLTVHVDQMITQTFGRSPSFTLSVYSTVRQTLLHVGFTTQSYIS